MAAVSTPSLAMRNQLASTRPVLVWLLAVQVFCAFLTETKFLPSVSYNFGAFEATALIFSGAVLIQLGMRRASLKMHPIILIVGAIMGVAAGSIAQLPSTNLPTGIVHLVILLSSFALIFILYNYVLLHQDHLLYLLRFFAYSAGIVSLWVIVDTGLSGGDINTAGPFRGRGHVGIYMLASFWVVLMNLSWPNTSQRVRQVLYVTLALVSYCIAASGRRSVYLSLMLGLAGLALSPLVTQAKERGRTVIQVVFILPEFTSS